MSLKIKLISCISAFILILGMFIAGVLSAQQAQVNIGGSISFNATDVYARVTGSVANAQSNPTLSDLLFTANDDSSPSETALATWSNMDLDFNQTPTPIEILITVENLSTERQLMVSLEDNIVSNGLNKTFTKDNEAYVTGNTDLLPASTGENTSTTTFLVTLSVAEPNLSLENVDFGFTLNLYDETAIPSYNDFEFELDEENGTATVTNYLGSGGAVTIPSSISTRIAEDGTTEYIMGSDYTVTAIAEGGTSSGPFYSARSTLTSITIPETIETIGNSAFRSCSGLTSITIGEGVTSIGNYAFRNCTALTEINYNATAANDLSSSNYVFYNAGQDGNGITVNIRANVRSLPNYIFNPYNSSSAPNITTVNFAEGSQCTSIGEYAFSNCDSLTSIIIPSNVTSIGDYAFSGCSGLTSITIPDSVTSIGGGAFYGCYALAEVYNYSNVTTNLPSYAKIIYNASQLAGNKPDTRITVVDNIQYYNYGDDFIALAPTSRNVTEVTLDSKATEINQFAFYYCSSLTSINIPEGVTSIGDNAFSDCSRLTSVGFRDNSQLTSIGDDAFSGCSSLTSITIPLSVESIGNYAFNDCNFTSVTIDSSYAYQNAGDTSNACGYLLQDANTVYVNSALITELGTDANSYLNENFGQPTDNGNGYYVYTRNA